MITLIMLISHTITDFIIQDKVIVMKKANMEMKGYISHGFGLLITSLPIFLFIKLDSIKIVTIIIVKIILLHIILDLVKEKVKKYVENHENSKVGILLLFMADQAIHIIVIIALTNGVKINFNIINEWFVNVIFSGNGLTEENLKAIFVVLYIAFSGAYFIPLVFDIVYEKVDNYSDKLDRILKDDVENDASGFIDEVKTGKWIGIFERILISIFLLSNELASVGFIIAIKSLARFKMMENKIFAEYYLLGTLFSVVYAFSTYEIFHRIL